MGNEFGEATVRMLGALILVIGIFLCFLFVMKKFRLASNSSRGGPAMRLLGTLSVAPKRAIALVEVYDEWLVIGIGTETVTLLSKIDQPSPGSFSDAGTVSHQNSFHSLLKGKGLRLKRGGGDGKGSHEDP